MTTKIFTKSFFTKIPKKAHISSVTGQRINQIETGCKVATGGNPLVKGVLFPQVLVKVLGCWRRAVWFRNCDKWECKRTQSTPTNFLRQYGSHKFSGTRNRTTRDYSYNILHQNFKNNVCYFRTLLKCLNYTHVFKAYASMQSEITKYHLLGARSVMSSPPKYSVYL